MAVPAKKTRKRGLEKQFAEWEKLFLRAVSGDLLDIQSQSQFLIDDFVKDYGKKDKQFLRSEVARIARDTLESVDWFYLYPLEAINTARRASKTIAKLDRDTEWLRNLNLGAIYMLNFASRPKDESDEELPLQFDWRAIIDALNNLHQLHATMQEKYVIATLPSGGRTEILARLFVFHMALFYERQFNKPAPRSKSGRFVRLMQAAWIDLRFPQIPEDTLGYMAERLPRL